MQLLKKNMKTNIAGDAESNHILFVEGLSKVT